MVRLNPNIPWKTRGNGAVCIQLSNQHNKTYTYTPLKYDIGAIDDNDNLHLHQTGYLANINEARSINSDEKDKDFHDDVLERVKAIIFEHAALEDESTNPGLVITDDSGLPVDLYWSAVQGVIEIKDIKKRLRTLDAKFTGFKKCRGIIGSSAAIAWAANSKDNRIKNNVPPDGNGLDHTFELISYRRPKNWGTDRVVDPEVVKELDQRFRSTFNNYDYTNHHVAITPNSPCPVLFGVRGDEPEELLDVLKFLEPNFEPIDKWLLFKSNQGTDDHLKSSSIQSINPYTSVILTGRVISNAWTIAGGHVFLKVGKSDIQPEPNENMTSSDSDSPGNEKKTSTCSCAAYEPTKEFRDIVRALRPGDIITVYGGVRSEPITINIEKLKIHKLEEIKLKSQNPRCPGCGGAMKSIGYRQGFRCRDCHIKIGYDKAQFRRITRHLTPGFYEVPVAARRHLSKPLKRLKNIPGHLNPTPKTI
jgi:tRNA(Ile2)-agmatinylcytidine synthase